MEKIKKSKALFNGLRIWSIFLGVVGLYGQSSEIQQRVTTKLDSDYPALDRFYKDLHSHPELSLMEKNTSAKLANDLRITGFEVTENFGGYGVVAVMKNGSGPTLMIRSDMDGLPVEEATDLSYASKTHVIDISGKNQPVMHACGHDIHMSVLAETGRTMASIKDSWHGTLILIGQPAEERVIGARAMILAGIFQKFPKPDYAIALHDHAQIPAGEVAFVDGYALANSDTVIITVHGIGGHGAYPHMTKDPVVLASEIVLALQTIVSREVKPGDPAVVTVGMIHGGNKPNVIPDSVEMRLTVRSYVQETRDNLISAIQRISRGQGISAGLPDNLLPTVEVVTEERAVSTYNEPSLNRRVRRSVENWLGKDAVKTEGPVMAAEDFGQFGRTVEHVPTCLFWLGAVDPKTFAESLKSGKALPSLHSSKFAPLPELTIKTGVKAMTAAALDLLGKTKQK
jgi:hippurate hydrolase